MILVEKSERQYTLSECIRNIRILETKILLEDDDVINTTATEVEKDKWTGRARVIIVKKYRSFIKFIRGICDAIGRAFVKIVNYVGSLASRLRTSTSKSFEVKKYNGNFPFILISSELYTDMIGKLFHHHSDSIKIINGREISNEENLEDYIEDKYGSGESDTIVYSSNQAIVLIKLVESDKSYGNVINTLKKSKSVFDKLEQKLGEVKVVDEDHNENIDRMMFVIMRNFRTIMDFMMYLGYTLTQFKES